MPTTDEFRRAVDHAATALFRAMRDGATDDDRERWADAAMHTVQICANQSDSAPLEAIDAAMAAIAVLARDRFAETINRRDRLTKEMRAELIANFARALDEEVARVAATGE